MKLIITTPQDFSDAANGLAVGFSKIGIEPHIFCIDLKSFHYQASQIYLRTPFRNKSRKHFGMHRSIVTEQLKEKLTAIQPDLVISFGNDIISEALVRDWTRESKKPWIIWLVEDPDSIDFFEESKIQKLPFYSRVLVPDNAWTWSLNFLEQDKVLYLPFAGDGRFFKKLNLVKDIDLLFVGPIYPGHPTRSIGPVRQTVIQVLRANGIHVRIIDRRIDQVLLNQYFNRARIVLSINHGQCKTDGERVIFDIALSGSFQLTDYRENIQGIFKNGIITFQSLEELVERVHQYSAKSGEREKIAEEALLIASQHHTYEQRAQEIINRLTL